MTNIAEIIVDNDADPNEAKTLQEELAGNIEQDLNDAMSRVDALEAADESDPFEAIINAKSNEEIQSTISIEISQLISARVDLVNHIREIEKIGIKMHKEAADDLTVEIASEGCDYVKRIENLIKDFETNFKLRSLDNEEQITTAKNQLYNLERKIQGFEGMAAGLRGASIPDPKKTSK